MFPFNVGHPQQAPPVVVVAVPGQGLAYPSAPVFVPAAGLPPAPQGAVLAAPGPLAAPGQLTPQLVLQPGQQVAVGQIPLQPAQQLVQPLTPQPAQQLTSHVIQQPALQLGENPVQQQHPFQQLQAVPQPAQPQAQEEPPVVVRARLASHCPIPIYAAPSRPAAEAERDALVGAAAAIEEANERRRMRPGQDSNAPDDTIPDDPPCQHNHWEKLRTRGGCNILRCFICLMKWKFNKFRSTYRSCQAYAQGECAKGPLCGCLHIERSRRKTREGEAAEAVIDH
eukprot:Hpha_TRINITY_DN14252_c0_g1::TRINITY_DN14252_c0_g1_i1::g.22135::m.22135